MASVDFLMGINRKVLSSFIWIPFQPAAGETVEFANLWPLFRGKMFSEGLTSYTPRLILTEGGATSTPLNVAPLNIKVPKTKSTASKCKFLCIPCVLTLVIRY